MHTPPTPSSALDLFACDVCGASDESHVRFCYACNVALCLDHWSQERQHGVQHRNFYAHQQTEISVARFVQLHLTDNDHDASTRARIHEEDSDTLWFGVDGQDTDQPSFVNNNVYQDLISQSTFTPQDQQFPRLVSFVGSTGAGKSYLIKSILSLQRSGDGCHELPKPIPGTSKTAGAAVSSDVHLYGDSATIDTKDPIMFADCEGLTGGRPEAARCEDGSWRSLCKPNRDFRHLMLPAGKTPSRRYCVEDLYPRILYSFSDVVCFVTQQTNIGQDLVAKLIVWADKVLTCAVNQSVLPYAIVVLNGTRGHSETWLDENIATQEIWSKIGSVTDLDDEIKSIAAEWDAKAESSNSKCTDLKTLAEHYFSAVRFIYIPDRRTAQPATFCRQLHQLYDQIVVLSTDIQMRKEKSWARLNSPQLGTYLGWAFDHFGRNPEEPFDFHAVALATSPLPSALVEHMVHFMGLVASSCTGGISSDNAPVWERQAADLLASYLFLISAERDFITHPKYLFQAELKSVCEKAFEDFYAQAPCGYHVDETKCVNKRNRHDRGHQSINGQVLTEGDYVSIFSDSGRTGFVDMIAAGFHTNVERIAEYRDTPEAYRAAALETHANKLVSYKTLYTIASSKTCLCCLTSNPVHVLPCRLSQHALCRKCVQRFGKQDVEDEYNYVIRSCPLCQDSTERKGEVWTMRFKPKQASPRILCLDGGGIRGIISVKILALLEKEIGLSIPIHHFFDMIVGTSTGGIIALGLSCNMWSAEVACEQFKCLAKESFQDHKDTWTTLWKALSAISIARFMQTFVHDGKYDARAIESRLQRAFGTSRSLFGNCGWEATARNGDKPRDLKTAVVTNDCCNTRAILLANYSRLETDGKIELFQDMMPRRDLCVWEAARCTSAAPYYFPPYKAFGREFQDGGLGYNCPIEVSVNEARTLWPNCSQTGLVVTIGTGDEVTPAGAQQRGIPPRSRLLPSFISRIFKSYASLLDCNAQYQNFMQGLPEYKRSRYHRLNVSMDTLPDLADTDAMDGLEALTLAKYMEGMTDHIQLRDTAAALIANLFYLEAHAATEVANNTYHVSGSIRCHLEHKYQLVVARRLLARNQRFDINGTRFGLTADDEMTAGKGQALRLIFNVTVPRINGRLYIKLGSGEKGGNKEYDISNSPCLLHH